MTVEGRVRPRLPRHLVLSFLAGLYLEVGDAWAAVLCLDEMASWAALNVALKGQN